MGAVDSSAAFLMAADQRELWDRVNAAESRTPVEPIGAALVARFADRAEQTAVVAAGASLTYRELAERAGAVADLLAGDPTPVAICVEPGWEQVVAVAGALVAAVPFVAVSPSLSQPARWGRLGTAGARRVLTQSWLVQRMDWPDGVSATSVDGLEQAVGCHVSPPMPELSSVGCWIADGADAPLMPLTVAALSGPLTDVAERFEVGAQDRLLAVTPVDDPIGLSGLLLALSRGGTLVIPEDIDLRTPSVWVDLIRRERVTVWHSTPALAALLVEHVEQRGDDLPETVRLALLGGEPLSVALARGLRVLGDGPRVVNLLAGGLAGLWAACHEVAADIDRRGHVPAGAPLAGTRVYVLNDALVLCPVWVTGRVHVGGALPSDIGQSGVRAPVMPGTGERVHRTDLLGRLLPDGQIEVVGEDATAVTIAGHPVNLRDIEAALSANDALRSAAVVQAGDSTVAYVKPAGGGVTSADVLDHLRRRMSPYLLPERVELVGAFPLTSGGRVDRVALAASAAPPTAAAPAPSGATAPDVVRRACELAAAILGVPEVEENANLLNLGANSVQIVRLAVQAEQELGIHADVEELLRFPSVAVLVSFASTETAEPPPGTAAGSVVTELILDPVERAAFTERQPGLRRALAGRPSTALPALDGATRAALRRRSTHRAFTGGPVPFEALAAVLGVLARLDDAEATPKYAYPSAGTLYPVQAYLTVTRGGVTGLAAGSYYYHPVDHRLVSVVDGAAVDDVAHAWLNREPFRSSAFSLYLVAALDAIAPMYGARARDYCLIEAGAMTQLLMTAASTAGLGLCPVGELDHTKISSPLLLNDSHAVMHTLLGGIPADDEDGTEAEMLRRVADLRSPPE
ncbi:AMP-binding protein [Actinokineospora guangxiensis]|uniref:AMP-binding protein n=1 Tax=Actinokineospora guangxiensis TaxID=1490288 RepID=A0ABW0EQS0_9PSEU